MIGQAEITFLLLRFTICIKYYTRRRYAAIFYVVRQAYTRNSISRSVSARIELITREAH